MSRKWHSLLFVMVLATLTVFVGCKDDTESPEESSFETLTMYMAANNMDLDDVLSSWIIAASDVVDNTDDYYIMDIRAAADYALGHVPGAVNSTLGTIVTDAAQNTENKPIIVVCYTGQSAGHAVVALRLRGYADAKVLKFGMSSWHSDFDRWTTSCASPAVGDANWTTDAVATAESFDYPDWSSTATDGAGILAERVAAMLEGGFKGVNGVDVLATPGDYFVNNYWAQSDVDYYGHIAGSYRIKEDLTLDADGFMHLDPSETVVTYCWTGQTSSVVTAYLTVLGYDAASLKFGVNSLIYDELESSKWTGSADYEYETG
jgi:rhodanese-related sulfurtransferase